MSSNIFIYFKEPVPARDWLRFCTAKNIEPLNEGEFDVLISPERIELWLSPRSAMRKSGITQITLSIGFMDHSRAKAAALLALELIAEWPTQSLSCSPEFETLITPTNPQLTPELRERLDRNTALIGGSWNPFSKAN